MIKLTWIAGRCCPFVHCDVCGLRIEKVGLGAVVFPNDGSTPSVPLHAHKGECHRRAEQHVGEGSGWVELRQHLSYLVENTGLTAKAIVDELRLPSL